MLDIRANHGDVLLRKREREVLPERAAHARHAPYMVGMAVRARDAREAHVGVAARELFHKALALPCGVDDEGLPA